MLETNFIERVKPDKIRKIFDKDAANELCVIVFVKQKKNTTYSVINERCFNFTRVFDR